jgi:hypothetical protein
MVVKLQLRNLDRPAAPSAGERISPRALVGTFLTGYLLVAEWPTRTLLYVVGGVLIALGLGLTIWLSRRESAVVIAIIVLGGAGVTIAAKASEPCDVESAYYCIHVERDFTNPSGRTLWLDDLRHSYVDLDDPTVLEFGYAKSIADV